MKRSELKEMGISEEAIEKIMAENGRDIENAKKEYSDYDEIKSKLESAENALNSMKDYENVKAEVDKYKAEAKKIQEEAAAKIAKMERENSIRDFTNNKKFVNDFTRDFVNNSISAEMDKAENKGKTIEELFKGLTDGKENIFIPENNPTPPNVPPMETPNRKDDIADRNAAREVMGLPPLKD